MRRRLVLILAATATVLGSFGAVAANASPARVEAPTTDTATRGYWACLAVDHVEVGACLENPLPDPSGLPSVRRVLHDATGVGV